MSRYPETGTGTSDGPVEAAQDHPETIGEFKVLAFLGDTPSGPVYRVGRAGTKDVYSLKVLSPEALADNETAARELPKLTQLRHPAIARVLDVAIDAAPPHLLTEFIPGVTLRDLIARRRLSFPQAFRIFKQMCEALEAAHGVGVLHRSLDPSKVMVTEDLSLVRLIDFAVGALIGGRVDVSSAGTQMMRGMNLVYRAPETLKQGIGKSGARADVYSAGVIFYELLTGRRPGGRLSLPSQLNSEVPPDLDSVVLRCLSVNPADRYRDFSEVLSDLRVLEDRLRLGLAHNLQGISRTTSRLLVNKEGQKRVPTAVLIAAGLLVIAALVLLVGLLLPQREGGRGGVQASAQGGTGGRDAAGAAGEAGSETADAGGTSGTTAGDESDQPALEASNQAARAEGEAAQSGAAVGQGESANGATTARGAGERAIPAAREGAGSARARSSSPARDDSGTSRRERPGGSGEAAMPTVEDRAEAAVDASQQVATDLEVARQKIEAGLAQAALEDVEQRIDPKMEGLPEDSALRLQVELVRAEALAAAGRLDDAKAALVEIGVRQSNASAIGASQIRLAELTLQGSSADRYQMASQIYHQLAERLPNTSWAPRALLAAADLERSHGWLVRDPDLGEVPAQVRTLRLLVQRYPKSSEAAGSLVRLAEACEELKLFQGAADAYWQLGELTGSSAAWWNAARLLDRRLDQNQRAIEAYRQVASSSEHYNDAQKRIRRLQ